jgi:DNA-binding transcriptional LysR family regulator
MHKTTLRRLEVFVAAVEAGSFQAAAERLGISQASISKQIIALEEQMGKQLFTRKRGSTSNLTSDGGITFELAKELIEKAERLAGGALGDTVIKGRQRITLASHPFLGWAIARPLAGYAADNPDIYLSVRALDYEQLVTAYAQKRIDVGIFLAPSHTPELPSSHLWTEPVGLYASAAHPLSALDQVRSTDLLKFGFIPAHSDRIFQELVDRSLAQVGIQDYRVALKSEHPALTIEALRLGLGYTGSFPRVVAGEGIPESDVKRLPIQVSGFEVRLCVQDALRHDPKIRSLIDFITHRCAPADASRTTGPAASTTAG